MTGTELIGMALRDLEVLGAGDDVPGEQIDDALDSINTLIDGLAIEPLVLYKTVRTTASLVASTASYSIGSGATINVARPEWIDRAGLILDSSAADPTEVKIKVLTVDQYADWRMKTVTGQPSAIWYDHGLDSSGYGLVYPLPVPDAATQQLVLYTPGSPLAEFDADTDVTLPRGYRRMLRKQAAMEIASIFGAEPSASLRRQAAWSLTAVRAANVRPRQRQNSPELVRGGRFSIESGDMQ